MIYTVTFNPALDYIVRVRQLNIGEINRAEYGEIMAGGKGVNVSLVLNNLGHESTALGFAAGFTGEKLIEDLKKKGCQCDFILLNQGMTRDNVKIKGQEETEINGEGPEITADSAPFTDDAAGASEGRRHSCLIGEYSGNTAGRYV